MVLLKDLAIVQHNQCHLPFVLLTGVKADGVLIYKGLSKGRSPSIYG